MKWLLFLGFLMAFSFNFVTAQEVARSYVGPAQNPRVKRPTVKPIAKPAQTTTSSTSKGEVYIGYSGTFAPISSGGQIRGNEKKVNHGVQTSVTVNVSRLVGLKGDFSGGYSDRKEAFAVIGRFTTTTRRTVIYNALGGVQFKDNKSDAVVQPFGHALIGVGFYRQYFRDCVTNNAPGTFCGTAVRDYGLAGAVGGGLDLRVGRRAGIRLVSDYNPMRIEGETIHNYRFGAGIVFK